MEFATRRPIESLKSPFRGPGPVDRVEINANVRVPLQDPTDFSFPSNHATNSAGFAFYIHCGSFPQLKFLLIPLVFLIGWSRVYVGVHFPSDVIAGWVLGITIAYLLRHTVFQQLKKLIHHKK